MPLNGFVSLGAAVTPRVVSIEFGDDELSIGEGRGEPDLIPYAQLKIRENRGGSLIVGRKWHPRFRLRLSGEAARLARQMLQPAPWPKRLGKWALGNPKAFMAIIIAPYFLLDALPASWLARAIPVSVTRGIEAEAIERESMTACNDPAGQAALQSLMKSVGPTSPIPRTIVINGPSFMVSARPGGEILVYRSAIAEIDSEVLAAMVAHALAHRQAGHTRIATARGEGSDYVDRLIFSRFDDELVTLVYSPAEEEQADRAAMAMLKEAGISLKPAAAFFARINDADAANRYWAQEYAEGHPGMTKRAAAWTAAAAGQGPTRPVLTERQADDLFNICWERPKSSLTKWGGDGI